MTPKKISLKAVVIGSEQSGLENDFKFESGFKLTSGAPHLKPRRCATWEAVYIRRPWILRSGIADSYV